VLAELANQSSYKHKRAYLVDDNIAHVQTTSLQHLHDEIRVHVDYHTYSRFTCTSINGSLSTVHTSFFAIFIASRMCVLTAVLTRFGRCYCICNFEFLLLGRQH